jgi:hypothetical protein
MMKKLEMAEFLADIAVVPGRGWSLKSWTNHYMKHSKAELELLIDAATNPDNLAARKLRDKANESWSRRQSGDYRKAGIIR